MSDTLQLSVNKFVTEESLEIKMKKIKQEVNERLKIKKQANEEFVKRMLYYGSIVSQIENEIENPISN